MLEQALFGTLFPTQFALHPEFFRLL